ncbi:MAG TPA: RNA 2',3'-cyclic phosphodiesterase [Lacipirellulaceae bacterium]|jgi:2'-5' RNA ligase|nr:RNA 2',3'-cyclic phosphodiesterase [Lacipirellulaceae bacterium]
MKLRTFIAVVASPEVRRSAAKVARLLGPVAGDVRWTPAENLHWTLQFLGEVDLLEIPIVCNAVLAAAGGLESFELECRGVGAFPAPDRPRNLWIGAGKGAQAMIALQAAIQAKLAALGFRGEARRYVPHLTLGRAGRDSAPRALVRELASLAEYDAGAMLVDEVTVFSSQLKPDGPVYEVLARAALAS